MVIICRENELKTLEKLYTSKRPEFCAVVGRRRIGKTFLIKSYASRKKDCIFFTATGQKDASSKEQIAHFIQRIGETFFDGMALKISVNWNDAFQTLTEAIQKAPKNKKIVIFIDELPWFATPKSKLLQTLDYYWNEYWSMDPRIKLIVCGSAASWIINKIIHHKGGLHNRLTETLYLYPFNLSETEKYLSFNNIKLTRKQITEIYMVTGGVPYYLSKIEPGLSATQVIGKIAFNKNAMLMNEFEILFSSLFDDSDACVEIIQKIAAHHEGLGQEDLFRQLTKTTKGNTGLNRLKALEDAGFITSFTPHFHKKRGIYYKVIDEYSLFYLNWLLPLKETKMREALESDYWKTVTQTPKWFSWAGYAFETLCFKHLNQIRRALNISATAIPNTWRFIDKKNKHAQSTGAQIDLLFDRDDDSITICEIKYTQKPFMIDKLCAMVLENKVRIFREKTKTNKQIFIACISANGIKLSDHLTGLIHAVVTLEDLYQPL